MTNNPTNFFIIPRIFKYNREKTKPDRNRHASFPLPALSTIKKPTSPLKVGFLL
jgi:hypothetical protein